MTPGTDPPRNALVIVANPSPQSFSHAMAEEATAALRTRNHKIVLHDLYQEQFDPVQPVGESGNRSSSDELVEAHCRDLAQADLILIFHPNWWGQLPAILKGWVDRVFRLGLAYDYPSGVGAEGIPVGLLRAQSALVFNTSNTPKEREQAIFGDPLERVWRDCVFGLCGVKRFERHIFSPIASSTPEVRQRWLTEVRAAIARQCQGDSDGV